MNAGRAPFQMQVTTPSSAQRRCTHSGGRCSTPASAARALSTWPRQRRRPRPQHRSGRHPHAPKDPHRRAGAATAPGPGACAVLARTGAHGAPAGRHHLQLHLVRARPGSARRRYTHSGGRCSTPASAARASSTWPASTSPARPQHRPGRRPHTSQDPDRRDGHRARRMHDPGQVEHCANGLALVASLQHAPQRQNVSKIKPTYALRAPLDCDRICFANTTAGFFRTSINQETEHQFPPTIKQ